MSEVLMKSSNRLVMFAKRTCANWYVDHCTMSSGPCRLQESRPCGYFEKAVLKDADPDYPYSNPQERLNFEDYLRLYKKCNVKYSGRVIENAVRVCGCGEPLKSRQRMCDICSRKARRESNRRNVKKCRVSM